MTPDRAVDSRPTQVLRGVAGLLRETAVHLQNRAGAESSRSTTHSLALGALLAFGSASALLPTAPFYDVPNRASTDPLVLVQQAEQLLRTVPIEQMPIGTTSLVIVVCDLARELRAATQ